MKTFKDIRESAKGMVPGFTVEIPKQTISGKTIGGGKNGMFIGKARTAREAIATAAKRLGVDFTMLKVGKVVKESAESESGAGAGFWGTDKLRKKLQKDTPGQAIKGIIKSEDVNEDPCWDSHKQVGTKKKGGKTVPNCVPKNEEPNRITKRLKTRGVDLDQRARDRKAEYERLKKQQTQEEVNESRVKVGKAVQGLNTLGNKMKGRDQKDIRRIEKLYRSGNTKVFQGAIRALDTDLRDQVKDIFDALGMVKKGVIESVDLTENRNKDLKDLETLSIAYVDQLRKGKDLTVLTKQISQMKKKLGVK